MRRSPWSALSALAGLAGLAVLTPTTALACGGLFCNASLPIPVEQSGERILFEIDPDAGQVTMTVDLTYSGTPDDFAWILPVRTSPEMPVPQLELAPPRGLLALDDATRARLRAPSTKCSAPPPPSCLFGCSETVLISSPDAGPTGAVAVDDLPPVGPYDTELVRSDDPGALVDWLQDNGYLVTPSMEPLIADYVTAGMAFLGLKLLAGAESSSVAPLSITLPTQVPTVPLRLTAVSAEPDLSVLVLIAADERWGSDSWANSELDLDRLQVNPISGQDNLGALIRLQLDELGGRAFLTQFAGPTDAISLPFPSWLNPLTGFWEEDVESRDWADAVLARRPYLTRLVTRVHPHELTVDPTFGPWDAGDVNRLVDLSQRPRYERCPEAHRRDRVVCGSTYCGEGARCADTDGGEGCVCAAGDVAREIVRVSGSSRVSTQEPTVTCQDPGTDLLGAAGACDDVLCGAGDCVEVGGFATCACDEGQAAVPTGDGTPVCIAALTTWDESRVHDWPGQACGCSESAGSPRLPALAWLLLLSATVGLRRRSRL